MLVGKLLVSNPLVGLSKGDKPYLQVFPPGPDLKIPIIQSGFGDGLYPVYFGFDKDNNICDLLVEYIYLG